MKAPSASTSKQDYGTPLELVDAAEAKFGPIVLDLAAHEGNHVRDNWLGLPFDSKTLPWAAMLGGKVGWLNPPYNEIPAWAKKCDEEASRGARILFLVPASVSSNWFWKYCVQHAVYSVSPRPVFRGTPINPKTGRPDPFMKDLMLVAFGWAPGPLQRFVWREKRKRLPANVTSAR